MSSQELSIPPNLDTSSGVALPKFHTHWARVVLMGFVFLIAISFVIWVAGHSALTRAFSLLFTNPWLVVAFTATYSAAFWLRAEAWRALLPELSRVTAFSALQSSLFANHLLPIKAGEIIRPYVASTHGIPGSRSLSTSVVARVGDYVCLFTLAAILIPLAPESPTEGYLGLMISASALSLGIASLFTIRHVDVPSFLPKPVTEIWTSVKLGFQEISIRRFVKAFSMTMPSWILESSALIVSAHALGIEISVVTAIAVTSFTLLFQILHFAPGGIGVYEASMTGALAFYGISVEEAVLLAVLTHGIKFAYSYTFSASFVGYELIRIFRLNREIINRLDKSSSSASRFEIVMARAWNVLNEGKPFTPVFTTAILILLSIPHLNDPDYLVKACVGVLALIPLGIVFYRFDFPLKLRSGLWIFLAIFVAVFQTFNFYAIGIALGLYLTFTIFLWGTVYYHFRIGMPWTNFTRFWRLVLENPDPTSGNFLEQTPKFLLLILGFTYLTDQSGVNPVLAIQGFTLAIGVTALFLHQWFFTWVPALPTSAIRRTEPANPQAANKVIAIVIDGCRADKFQEAKTPFMDKVRQSGTEFTDMRTVYPARTVTAFSSMLTGAAPEVHGMKSNFVPSLGVKCESVFDVLESNGRKGRLVGIAHLVDAFGENIVETVSAVNDNDVIDYKLSETAKRVLEEENPDLLVLQLLSVDQTGHARGSYNSEYIRKIEETDVIIQEFLNWCEQRGHLDNARIVITSDHGQGKGIGGHGHLTESERQVPFIMSGGEIEKGQVVNSPRHLTDVAPTLMNMLGMAPPRESVGRVLTKHIEHDGPDNGPVAIVIPAFNESESLPKTLSQIPHNQINDLHVIVVDDGSTDDTAILAESYGAKTVISHDRNHGLGAALRTGLKAARNIDARAAIYIDADGEYNPSEIPILLEEIDSGRADYVLGNRIVKKGERQDFSRQFGNRLFTTLLSISCGRRIKDGQTGFRAFSRNALEVAEIIHDYNYAQVLTLDLLKKGLRLTEVPISWRRRRFGKSFINWQYLWRVPVGMAREMWSS